MTIAAERVANGVTQERNLVTDLPGPRLQALLVRKENAVPSGVSIGLKFSLQKPVVEFWLTRRQLTN